MEDRKLYTIASFSILSLVIVIIISRLSLKQSKAFYVILGADFALILALISLVVFRFHHSKKQKSFLAQISLEGRELRIEYSFLRKVAGLPTKFRLKELEEATDNFTTLIGRGSSASVFKGILSDGTEVAVKRIEEETGEREFKSEVAAIGSAQHRNLVRLLGYCCAQNGPRFLVYDFIPNGSLDKWIFPRTGSRTSEGGGCLSWDLRCRVAIDVAKALSYLHNDCRSKILHLDVKPENILLDENYHAIVSDFGLSKKMNMNESRILTTIRGTKGYLAPEWLLENGISEKSDIFSYGMVLLEIIGGRRNVSIIEETETMERKFEYFPKIVSDKVRGGKIMEVLDERIEGEGIADEVKKLVYIALWCIQEKTRLRPSITEVVEMLEGRVIVEEPPETKMVIVDVLTIDVDNSNNNENGKKKYAAYARDKINCDLPSGSVCRSLTMPILSGR